MLLTCSILNDTVCIESQDSLRNVALNSKVKIMKIVLANKNPRAGQEGDPVERQTYTIEEAAKILGICRAVAYRKGVLPTVKIAGRRLVPKRALERMLAETAEPSVTNRDEGTVGVRSEGARERCRFCLQRKEFENASTN